MIYPERFRKRTHEREKEKRRKKERENKITYGKFIRDRNTERHKKS